MTARATANPLKLKAKREERDLFSDWAEIMFPDELLEQV